MRKTLRSIAARFGITSSAFLWRNLAIRQYAKKLKDDPVYRRWESATPYVKDHWGHYRENDPLALAHLSSQLFEISLKLKSRRVGGYGKTILDAGASDGMFLSLVGANKDSVGINFLPKCVSKIQSDGFDGVQSDLTSIPICDNYFYNTICTETLEHVLNPVAVLNELARVTKGTIYLTIPWVDRTNIYEKPAGWPDVESHVFEFSPEDFRKIVSHSNLRITYSDVIQVFYESKNPLLNRWITYWMSPHFFPKLQYYELEKR